MQGNGRQFQVGNILYFVFFFFRYGKETTKASTKGSERKWELRINYKLQEDRMIGY